MTNSETKGGLSSLRQPILVVLAVGLGALIGSLSPSLGVALVPFGQLYMSLLLMCIVPLLFTAIISSLGQMVAKHKLGRQLAVMIAVFAIGLVLSAATGTAIGRLTGIGEELRDSEELGMLLLTQESTSQASTVAGLSTSGARDERHAELFEGTPPTAEAESPIEVVIPKGSSGVMAYLKQLVPGNLASAVLEENYLAVLFFSVLLGVALGSAPSEARASALRVLEAFFDALLRIIGWILLLLPLGLTCIVAGVVARGGLEFVPVLGKLVGVSALTTGVIVLMFAATIWIALRCSIGQVFRGLRGPALVAFATSSSLASIPTCMLALRHEYELDAGNVKLILPLGVMLNPIGSALFFSISATFAVQLHAESSEFSDVYIFSMIVVGAVLAGLAAMGLPGPSSVWMLGIVLGPLGVPPEVGIIALLAVTPIIDPMFTMVNVLGNCTATVILDRTFSGGAAPMTAE